MQSRDADGQDVRGDRGRYRVWFNLGAHAESAVGWRNEFRVLALVCCLGSVSIGRSARSLLRGDIRPISFAGVIHEYVTVLDSYRGGRTIMFIFCNGAFHVGIFAWLGLLLTRRYHLEDAGIGLALAGYGLPGILFGATIGR
jgi:predicted MFS family arabinose efflux permease